MNKKGKNYKKTPLQSERYVSDMEMKEIKNDLKLIKRIKLSLNEIKKGKIKYLLSFRRRPESINKSSSL